MGAGHRHLPRLGGALTTTELGVSRGQGRKRYRGAPDPCDGSGQPTHLSGEPPISLASAQKQRVAGQRRCGLLGSAFRWGWWCTGWGLVSTGFVVVGGSRFGAGGGRSPARACCGGGRPGRECRHRIAERQEGGGRPDLLDGGRARGPQVKALAPVMSRPTTRVWMVSVPS